MAAYEETLVSISLDAAEGLAQDTAPPNEGPGNQYRFVRVSGAHECDLYDGTEAGHVAVGVLQSKPQVAGQACTVAISGVSLVEAGDEIDPGDVVGADDDGRAVPVGSGVALGVAIHGGDLPDDSTGELIPVLLNLPGAAVSA